MPAKRAAAVKKEDDKEEDAGKGGDGAHEPSSPYEFSSISDCCHCQQQIVDTRIAANSVGIS